MLDIVLFIAVVLVFIAVAAATWFVRQKWQSVETTNQHLEQQVRILIKSNVGIGSRVNELEVRLEKINYQQEDLAERTDEDVSISHAAKLVELGADIDEVMRSCSLSRGEAEFLLTMRHAKDQN